MGRGNHPESRECRILASFDRRVVARFLLTVGITLVVVGAAGGVAAAGPPSGGAGTAGPLAGGPGAADGGSLASPVDSPSAVPGPDASLAGSDDEGSNESDAVESASVSAGVEWAAGGKPPGIVAEGETFVVEVSGATDDGEICLSKSQSFSIDERIECHSTAPGEFESHRFTVSGSDLGGDTDLYVGVDDGWLGFADTTSVEFVAVVPGEVDASVAKFDVTSGELSPGDDVTAAVTVENTGDTRETFHYGIDVIHESTGETVYVVSDTVALDPAAKQTVTHDATVGESWAEGSYRATVTLRASDEVEEVLDAGTVTDAFVVDVLGVAVWWNEEPPGQVEGGAVPVSFAGETPETTDACLVASSGFETCTQVEAGAFDVAFSPSSDEIGLEPGSEVELRGTISGDETASRTVSWPDDSDDGGEGDDGDDGSDGDDGDDGDDGVAVSVETTRTETAVLSPVTLQVTDPTGEEYRYAWEVVSAPAGSDPGLLHEVNEHTALRPDLPGEYVLAVNVRKNGDLVGRTSITVEAESRSVVDLVSADLDVTVRELARRYAPALHFHEDERFYPTRYEAYAENSKLQTEVGDYLPQFETLAEGPSLFDLANPDLTPEYTPGDIDNRLHLVDDEEDFEEYQEEYPPTVHVSATDTTFRSREYVALTYWKFYLYDFKEFRGLEDLPGVDAVIPNHGADTETVTVLVNESGPQWVAVSQHYSGEYVEWEKAAGTSGPASLDVYPARGSHGAFLVETEAYDSKVPGQWRWLQASVDSTSTFPISTSGDRTGSAETWTHDGAGADRAYDLVYLTGEEPWMEFEGYFTSRPGNPVVEIENLPVHRGDRWSDTGQWIPGRMIPGHEVVDAATSDGGFAVDPDAPRVQGTVSNLGVKPHPFAVVVTVTPADGDDVLYTATEAVRVAYDDAEPVSVSLDEVPPIDSEYDVTVKLLAYGPGVATGADVLERETFTTPIETPVDAEVSVAGGAGVTADDAVESTLSVENTGGTAHSFSLTYAAEGPDGEYHNGGRRTVTLAPGETRRVDVSWTVGDLPPGTYDLVADVWFESGGDLSTRLDRVTDPGAISVDRPDGVLAVRSPRDNATVVVDGEALGTAPLTTVLPAGPHELSVVVDGYDPAETTVTVEAGETTTVTLDPVEATPVVGDSPPRDLDGDGLYEDVTGDGELTVADVQALFAHLYGDAVQDASGKFAFSGHPAEVRIADVQALYDELTG